LWKRGDKIKKKAIITTIVRIILKPRKLCKDDEGCSNEWGSCLNTKLTKLTEVGNIKFYQNLGHWKSEGKNLGTRKFQQM